MAGAPPAWKSSATGPRINHSVETAMKTTTTFIDDYKYRSVTESGAAVEIEISAAGADSGHQSPTELLLSALSACSSVDLVQMLKKRRKTVNGLTVAAEGERREDHPRAFTHIRLTFTVESPDVEQAEFEKLGHLAATKYCSVAGTLNATMDHTFEIVRPGV